MEGILVIAAIVVVVWIWQKVTSAAGSAVNRHVLSRGDYADEKEVTGNMLDFRSSLSPSAISQALRTGIEAGSEPLAIKSSLYLVEGTADSSLMYRYGNKLDTSFQAVITFRPVESGTTGAFAITNWTQSDGVMLAVDHATGLRNAVVRILREQDPQITIRKVATTSK